MAEKAIIFSDLHVSPIKGLEMFVDTPLKCINSILDYAEKNNIKHIWNLGDTFHLKETVYSYLLPKAKPTFQRFKEFESIFSVGNHDLVFRKNSRYNLLELFDEYVEIVQDPYTIKEFGNNRFIFTNYTSADLIAEGGIPIDDKKQNILLGHFDCNGFPANANYVVDNAKIGIEDLKAFERVFVGHYHTRMRRENVQYVGSTHQQRRSDINNPYGFMILDLETLSQSFRTYDDYTPPTFQEYPISQIKEIKKAKNSFLKINITEDENMAISQDSLLSLRKYLKERGNYGVTFSYTNNKENLEVGDGIEEEMGDMGMVGRVEIDDMFETYIQNVKTKLDKNILRRLIKRGR